MCRVLLPVSICFSLLLVTNIRGDGLNRTSVETPIFWWSAQFFPDSVVASPDCRHMAGILRLRGKQVAVVDGKKGKSYDLIRALKFSPDSKRVLYVARSGVRYFLVVDGRESAPYTNIFTPVFSPDSKRIACVALQGDKSSIVVDGSETRSARNVENLTFSPDSKRVAYIELHGLKQHVVVDGNEGPDYHQIYDFTFSPDSQRTAYLASEGAYQLVVLNGKEEPRFTGILQDSLLFSPDSRRFSYAAVVGDKKIVVLDGVRQLPCDEIEKGQPIFSSDSRHLAYESNLGEKQVVILDGKPVASFHRIDPHPLFSPDGKRLAFDASNDGKKWFAVIDGKKSKEYDAISGDYVCFSPDSQHVVFGGRLGEKWLRVRDGVEGPLFDQDYAMHQFSPDSQHFAYVARNGTKQSVILDGVEQEPCDLVFYPYMNFSPDSKVLAYAGRDGDDSFVFLSQDKRRIVARMPKVTNGKLAFDAPEHIHYIVRRGNSGFLVDETWGSTPPVPSPPAPVPGPSDAPDLYPFFVDLPTAEKQINQVLEDRPQLKPLVRKGTPVWNWLVSAFGNHPPNYVIRWNNKPTTPERPTAGSQCSGYYDDEGVAEIRVDGVEKEGPHTGTPRTGEEVLGNLVFELNNLKRWKEFRETDQLIIEQKITRDEYVEAYFKVEYMAEKETSDFYRSIWFPYCKAENLKPRPEFWCLDCDDDFDVEFGKYPRDSLYPWKYYGNRYDSEVAYAKANLPKPADPK